MSVLLSRQAMLETFEVELQNGMDDQGRPSYDSPLAIDGRVVRENTVVRMADGSQVRSFVTVWVPGTESPLPNTDNRVTFADGLVGIVVERYECRTFGDVLDHVRIKAREE